MKYLNLAMAGKAAALLAIVLSGSTLLRAQKADSAQISQLFAEIKGHATLAEDDAQLLESYARSNMRWQSHATKLNSVKDHANDLIRDFNKAKSLRDDGSPWQAAAIDQLEPLLQSMAKNLTATIAHHRENPQLSHMQPYLDYVHANQEYATKTAKLIRDLVDYGEAKVRSEELEGKLELPASAERD